MIACECLILLQRCYSYTVRPYLLLYLLATEHTIGRNYGFVNSICTWVGREGYDTFCNTMVSQLTSQYRWPGVRNTSMYCGSAWSIAQILALRGAIVLLRFLSSSLTASNPGSTPSSRKSAKNFLPYW